jgi:hypothetical protein
MGYLLVVAVCVILVGLGLFALSAAMVLVGRVLGLLFPITPFEGALITTLVALGAILAFVLGYVGRIGEEMSHALAYLQEDDKDDEDDEDDEDDDEDGDDGDGEDEDEDEDEEDDEDDEDDEMN